MVWFQALVTLAVLSAICSMIWHGIGFAPFVPSDTTDIDRSLRLAGLAPGERLLDLGSGDGRVVRRAATMFGATAVGYEGVWLLVGYARLRQWLRPIPGVRFRHANFFATPFEPCDVVYMYGLPSTVTENMWPKLVRDLAPGTRVLSFRFPIAGVVPVQAHDPQSRWMYPVYLYASPTRGAVA
jgi:SAM-dependent methyltransferase